MNASVLHTWLAISLTHGSATLCLILRLWGRWIKDIKWWIDDYFAVAAWVFAVSWNADMIIWISHGFGQHISDLPAPVATTFYYAKLLTWNCLINYTFSLGCSKLSILSLYWRVFGVSSHIRIPILILGSCTVIWMLIRTCLNVFMCVPIHGFWDKTIHSTCYVDEEKFLFGTSLVHLTLDVAILSVPLWEVSRLQLEIMQKLGLVVTFACGILVVVASIIVLAPTFHYSRSDDITWLNVSLFQWATVEVNLAVIAGSFPMLPAAIKRIFIIIIHPGALSDNSGNRFSLAKRRRGGSGVILATINRMQRNMAYESATSLADRSFAGGDHGPANFSHESATWPPKMTQRVDEEQGHGRE